MWEQALAALRTVEQQTGKHFGQKDNPLLVSVRSGAKFSMPDMMDTVLNLGINDQTVLGLVKLTGDERFAYDAYRRFIQMFSKIVLDTDPRDFEHLLDQYKQRTGVATDAEIPAANLERLVADFKQVAERQSGEPFPTDVYQQLHKAIEAVFSSWNNKRAIDYRNFNKIPHNLGTAVNVQSMVFGNMGNDSGTGVAFTRDPSTGDNQLYGEFVDEMIRDGLWDVFNQYHMGITAENICTECNLTREELDAFALESQQRAAHAIETGTFRAEIVPVEVPGRKGTALFEQDQQPRADTTAEALAKLRPAFKKDGMVTAGNSSGLNDGGAAVVVMSASKAEELGLKPLATIRSYASAGVDPRVMGLGPIPSSRRALEKAGLSVPDMDLVEANEAFVAQSVAVGKELGFDRSKLNVNGGAIALGHPIGASGTRILVTLLYEMQRRNAHYGLATLCIGGGQGVAMIVER